MPPSATRAAFPLVVQLLFRVFSQMPCSSPLSASASLEDLLPFGAFVPKKSTYPRCIPSFGLRSAFRVSHPLRGLLLPRPRRFISPRKRPSVFPSGISPPKELRQLFAGAVPSCRCSVVALPSSRVTGPTAYLPSTPRKWDKYLWPTSRLCSP
jgi:hypothetical protein